MGILAAIFVINLISNAGWSDDVTLPANTTFYTKFSADGHMKSNSTGKIITLYPRGGFPVEYKIVNGSHLHSVDYGNEVARITMKKDGTFKIYSCVNSHVDDAIGYTWVPENIHSYK